jgi:glutathione synthase
MEAWENIDPEVDSSLRLIHECLSRGYQVGIFQPFNLTIRENITYVLCRFFEKRGKISENILTFYKKAKFSKQRVPLKGFDAIFIRKVPPVDSLMLNFLDSVKEDTFIINDLEGLRKASNKIYMTTFDEAKKYIPETHVSKDIEYLESVIHEKRRARMILKPLEGYGGQGVIVLESKAKTNIRSLLEFYIGGKGEKNYVILQEYVHGAEGGDIRALVLNGEPIGAMKRVPKKGDARSNIHAGGTAKKHVLSKREIELCKLVGKRLVRDGIYFAGLDIISGKLIEVNVLSPGGITRINRFNKTKLQKKIIDFVEFIVQKREDSLARKLTFKKVIEDA